MTKCSNKTSVCKSFKILGSGIGFKGGRYVAENRMTAAKRAGSKLYNKVDNNAIYEKFKNKKSIKFILGEITQGGDKKTTAFQVSRTELDTPKTVKIGSQTIVYKYTYNVQKLINVDGEDMDLM
jgi:hypothetical protein